MHHKFVNTKSSYNLYYDYIMFMESFEVDSCVRGYHVYQSIWTPMDGEILSYVPLFPFIVPVPSSDSTMALTLLFATSMLDDGTSRDNGPFGDGSTFFGLKYFSIDIFQLNV